MTVIREFRQLPGQAKQLLVASGVNSLGSGLVLPLLVVYLVKGHGFGMAVPTDAVALTSVTALLGGLLAGWVSDRYGRIPAVLGAMLLATAGTCLYAAVNVPWQAFAAAAVFGFGVGGNSSWQALLAESVPPEARTAAFSMNFGVMNAALGLGGLISGAVVESGSLASFRILYLINGLSFLAAGWIMAGADRRMRRAAAVSPALESGKDGVKGSSYLALLRNPGLLAAFAVTFLLFMAGYGQLEAGVPAVLVAKAGMNAGDISKIFVTDTIFAVVAQVTLMGVVKKLSHRTSLAFAALSWSVFWALIFAVTKMHNAAVELTLVCVGAAIASTGAAFFSAVVPTLIHAAADDAERGRANALYGVSISVGYTLGPAAAGVFTGHGMAETFVFAAIGLTLVVGLLAAVLRFEAADASDAVTEHAEVGWSPEPEAIDR